MKEADVPGESPQALSPDDLRYGAGGLLPAVIQDSRTGAVLMVGYMDREALRRTIESGRAWFWSRSRREYWQKGATSGNILAVQAIYADCDADTLLVKVVPQGPGVVCHTGRYSCFFNPLAGFRPPAAGETANLAAVPARLAETIKDRRVKKPADSYTARLLEEGPSGIARRLGEEALEAMLAYLERSRAATARAAADLLFHLLVLLEEADIPLEAVLAGLAERGREP